jgi:hypothetical protein
MAIVSIHFSEINLNACWEFDKLFSNKETHFFKALSCNDMPTVLIENTNGKYRLQFNNEKSSIKITEGRLWYNRTDLNMLVKIT